MRKTDAFVQGVGAPGARIKQLATKVGGYRSFAELTALVMAERFAAQHRPFEARRILQAFLKSQPATPRVLAKLRSLA